MSEAIRELAALIRAHRQRLVSVHGSLQSALDPERWHSDLLQKMTLEIDGVRAAAVSEAAFSPLFELLKFRHFKRYYFELEYDWDRLDYLVAKLSQAHPLVMHDLERFARFMDALEES